jgi:hypothetical protein
MFGEGSANRAAVTIDKADVKDGGCQRFAADDFKRGTDASGQVWQRTA